MMHGCRKSSGFARRFKAEFAVSALALLVFSASTRAGPVETIILNREPIQTGGLASDTLYSGDHMMQLVADDIMLSAPAEITHLNYWGFYDQDNPPATETMRIRFMGARPGDGLPDENNVVFEETFVNPSRVATGQTVFTGVDPDEYFYEVDLSSPAELDANTLHWLEIVQIGDIETRFRWEFSGLGPTGLAFINPGIPDWQETTFSADNAFQLLIPEPPGFLTILVGCILLCSHWGRRSFVK